MFMRCSPGAGTYSQRRGTGGLIQYDVIFAITAADAPRPVPQAQRTVFLTDSVRLLVLESFLPALSTQGRRVLIVLVGLQGIRGWIHSSVD